MSDHEANAKAFRQWRESLQDCLPHQREPVAPYVRGDIEPYQSPVDDRVISSRPQHLDELRRNNCRVYEGREQETREAERVQMQNDAKLEETISDSVDKTYADLKEGRIAPDKSESVPFTFGLD